MAIEPVVYAGPGVPTDEYYDSIHSEILAIFERLQLGDEVSVGRQMQLAALVYLQIEHENAVVGDPHSGVRVYNSAHRLNQFHTPKHVRNQLNKVSPCGQEKHLECIQAASNLLRGHLTNQVNLLDSDAMLHLASRPMPIISLADLRRAFPCPDPFGLDSLLRPDNPQDGTFMRQFASSCLTIIHNAVLRDLCLFIEDRTRDMPLQILQDTEFDAVKALNSGERDIYGLSKQLSEALILDPNIQLGKYLNRATSQPSLHPRTSLRAIHSCPAQQNFCAETQAGPAIAERTADRERTILCAFFHDRLCQIMNDRDTVAALRFEALHDLQASKKKQPTAKTEDVLPLSTSTTQPITQQVNEPTAGILNETERAQCALAAVKLLHMKLKHALYHNALDNHISDHTSILGVEDTRISKGLTKLREIFPIPQPVNLSSFILFPSGNGPDRSIPTNKLYAAEKLINESVAGLYVLIIPELGCLLFDRSIHQEKPFQRKAEAAYHDPNYERALVRSWLTERLSEFVQDTGAVEVLASGFSKGLLYRHDAISRAVRRYKTRFDGWNMAEKERVDNSLRRARLSMAARKNLNKKKLYLGRSGARCPCPPHPDDQPQAKEGDVAMDLDGVSSSEAAPVTSSGLDTKEAASTLANVKKYAMLWHPELVSRPSGSTPPVKYKSKTDKRRAAKMRRRERAQVDELGDALGKFSLGGGDSGATASAATGSIGAAAGNAAASVTPVASAVAAGGQNPAQATFSFASAQSGPLTAQTQAPQIPFGLTGVSQQLTLTQSPGLGAQTFQRTLSQNVGSEDQMEEEIL